MCFWNLTIGVSDRSSGQFMSMWWVLSWYASLISMSSVITHSRLLLSTKRHLLMFLFEKKSTSMLFYCTAYCMYFIQAIDINTFSILITTIALLSCLRSKVDNVFCQQAGSEAWVLVQLCYVIDWSERDCDSEIICLYRIQNQSRYSLPVT